MADYRESTIYVQADMEGYLEKKGNWGKKTRRWCWVQGSIFYQQKPASKDLPGDIEVLDMSDVKFVRKVSQDTTETTFEIFTKKQQIYICGSRDECTNWIKALQKAMMIKGSNKTQENPRSNFYTPSEANKDIYSEIPDNGETKPPNLRNGHSPTPHNSDIDVYSMPQDYVDNENVYSDVADVDDSQNGPRIINCSPSAKTVPKNSPEKSAPPVPRPRRDSNNNGNDSAPSCYADGVSLGATQNENCYADGVSTGAKESDNLYADGVSTGAKNSDNCYADGISMSTQEKTNNFVKKDSSGSSIGPSTSSASSSIKPNRQAPVAPHIKVGSNPSTASTNHPTKAPSPPQPQSQPNVPKAQTETQNQTTELVVNREDQLQHIFNAMDVDSGLPDIEFVLSNDDAIPVTELKACLRQNDVHCRISTNRLSNTKDPISSCKSYLATLDSAMG